jgi:hypothetical protein
MEGRWPGSGPQGQGIVPDLNRGGGARAGGETAPAMPFLAQ